MSDVSITLNYPFRELQEEGFYKSRLARDMRPCQLVYDSTGSPNVKYRGTYSLPIGLWQEPSTGVIMLKPAPLRADFKESSTYSSGIMKNTDFHYNSGDIFQVPNTNTFISKRTTSVAQFLGLLADTAVTAILNTIHAEHNVPNGTMMPVMQSIETFQPNEGFSIEIHNPGTFTDRATDWKVLHFGRYALHFRTDGTAKLWVDVTYDFPSVTSSWQSTAEFRYKEGGVNHNVPFQVTIIPWGVQYITFLFTQTSVSSIRGFHTGSAFSPEQSNASFLYDIYKTEGRVTEFSSTLNQYIKTDPFNLTVSLRSDKYQYGFSLSRIRYPTSAIILHTLPENLSDTHTNIPLITSRGYTGQTTDSESQGASLAIDYTNDRNQTWLNTRDKSLVPKITFQSDLQGLYTPELWYYDLAVPEFVWTPPWTPIDMSDKWTFLRFERTTDLDTSKGDIKFEDKDGFDRLLLDAGNPIRVQVEDITILDGYIDRKQPTMENYDAKIVSQVTILGMWTRLNEKRVGDYSFLDGLYVSDTIVTLIQKCGFESSDIIVIDPDEILSNVQFSGFNDPHDIKVINPDASVGDVIREIARHFFAQPLRVLPFDGKWYIYLAPSYEYTPGVPPPLRFALSGVSDISDEDRFSQGIVKITGNLDYTNEQLDFNAILCRASSGIGANSEGLEVAVPGEHSSLNDWAHRTINDPTSPWFNGRLKIKLIAPPEIPLVNNLEDLIVAARLYWDRYSKKKRLCEVTGEWNSTIDVDQFVWITGLDPDGNEVSFGAYRIDHLDCEIRYDSDNDKNLSMRWSDNCKYSLVFVGKADTEDIPMFVEDDLLPL